MFNLDLKFNRFGFRDPKDIERQVERRLDALVDKHAEIIQRKIQSGMKDEPKTGRIYFIDGKFHQASAVGEFPAVLSGRLLNSIRIQRRGHEAEISTNVEYARVLQSKMGRPFIRPWMGEEFEDEVVDFIKTTDL